MKNFILRQEPFGFTFYDRRKLRQVFLKTSHLNSYLKEKGIKQTEIEYLRFGRSDYRKDILYSPIRIYYELTLQCNLRCRYCFNSSGKARSHELTTSEVLKSIDKN